MEDKLIMSKRELERKTLLESFKCGKFTLIEVSKHLNLSYRQIKRIWKKYKNEGDFGLCHKNRGKKPPLTHNEVFKKKILELYRQKYMDFGPTYAAEKFIEDDQLIIHPETLRLWLKKAGLWYRKRKHYIYRERRERKPHFGDLLQIDGSIHRWFEDRDEHFCLLNIVDDATGITFALLDKGETTKVLLTTLKRWIEKYGIPKAVYVDLKSVYVGLKKLVPSFDEETFIQDGFSVFEQVCKDLNIQIIRAYSPQAKGRVERKHAVFQDRLVKDIKLYGLKTIEEVNRYLEETFLDKINYKFAHLSADIKDSHREATLYGDLNQIICWRHIRQLRNDWTIRFKNEYFQVEKYKDLKPEDKILIKKYLNGTMKFWFGEEELTFRQLAVKPIPPSKQKKPPKERSYDPILMSKLARKRKANTPWRFGHILAKRRVS